MCKNGVEGHSPVWDKNRTNKALCKPRMLPLASYVSLKKVYSLKSD